MERVLSVIAVKIGRRKSLHFRLMHQLVHSLQIRTARMKERVRKIAEQAVGTLIIHNSFKPLN